MMSSTNFTFTKAARLICSPQKGEQRAAFRAVHRMIKGGLDLSEIEFVDRDDLVILRKKITSLETRIETIQAALKISELENEAFRLALINQCRDPLTPSLIASLRNMVRKMMKAEG